MVRDANVWLETRLGEGDAASFTCRTLGGEPRRNPVSQRSAHAHAHSQVHLAGWTHKTAGDRPWRKDREIAVLTALHPAGTANPSVRATGHRHSRAQTAAMPIGNGL